MDLYLLRHGIAAPRESWGAGDHERPLTPEGRSKLKRLTSRLRKLELGIELVLSSPLVRAQQTAQLVAAGLRPKPKLELTEALTPGAPLKDVVAELRGRRQLPSSVLLVGHDPHLSELAGWLIGGEDGAGIALKKGGLCKLAIAALREERCAVLEWLVTPRLLAG